MSFSLHPCHISLAYVFLHAQAFGRVVVARWMYSLRAREHLLPYASAYSKTVKRALALMWLEPSLMKSCHHSANENFIEQVNRLQVAGYPSVVSTAVCEVLLQKLKKQAAKNQECNENDESGSHTILP